MTALHELDIVDKAGSESNEQEEADAGEASSLTPPRRFHDGGLELDGDHHTCVHHRLRLRIGVWTIIAIIFGIRRIGNVSRLVIGRYLIDTIRVHVRPSKAFYQMVHLQPTLDKHVQTGYHNSRQ